MESGAGALAPVFFLFLLASEGETTKLLNPNAFSS